VEQRSSSLRNGIRNGIEGDGLLGTYRAAAKYGLVIKLKTARALCFDLPISSSATDIGVRERGTDRLA
jgi:hypothetical protein